jgi:hypothetical protein
VATSRALLGRPIERTDGPDRASAGYFAKRPSNYGKIKPAVQQPLIEIFAKRPSIFLENEARSILHSALSPIHGPVSWSGWAEFGPTTFYLFPVNLLFV